MKNTGLKFTAIICKEGNRFVALCPELDVSSHGKSLLSAKKMIEEAVMLYLDTAITSNLPYLRPVPSAENPVIVSPLSIVATFDLDVSVRLIAHAA